MQIHELPTLPSADGSEYVAVDTGSATYKMKTLLATFSATAMRLVGSLIVNVALGTGGRTAWNDTTHYGCWLNSAGALHLAESATSGGDVSFHYNLSANATTRIYEHEAGVLTNTGRFVTKDWTGTGRTPASSATTDGGKVGYLQAMSSALRVSGQWGVAGGSFGTNDIPVSASDIRLKDNVHDCDVDALEIINQIKMRSFDWKNGRGHQDIGMIADEIESLDNMLVLGGGEDEDGNPIYKSVDTFYLVGYLVKAVQELSAEVERLRG